MSKELVAGIAGKVLATAAISTGAIVNGWSTAGAGERFSMQFVCPEETLVWTAGDFKRMSLRSTAGSESAGIAFEFEYEAAAAFSDLTERSIGLICELYGNDVLIASIIIRSRIRSGTGVAEMDAELAKELVESYEAERAAE